MLFISFLWAEGKTIHLRRLSDSVPPFGLDVPYVSRKIVGKKR
jgi:hypothetical protein